MNYIGKLYGKYAGKYIPLTATSEDVDKLERENARLREVMARLQNCATALLGWHSDGMSIGAIREVTQAVKDANDILSNAVITNPSPERKQDHEQP